VDANDLWVAFDDVSGNKVFACGVGFDDCMNEVLRNFAIVCQQLLGVFWQTVAAVTERGVVVMIADARIEADALNDLLGIQPCVAA